MALAVALLLVGATLFALGRSKSDRRTVLQRIAFVAAVLLFAGDALVNRERAYASLLFAVLAGVALQRTYTETGRAL